MAPAATPTTVGIGQDATGQLSIIGIISNTPLNGNYATRDLTFANSAVVTAGSNVTLTLGPCNTTGQCYTGGSPRALAGTSSPGISFSASPSLRDGAGNLATGSFTTGNNYRLF